MMIFLIALIPALAVIVTAIATDSKTKTTIAAVIAAAVGIFTGNPAFAVIDLVFVGVAYWIAMAVMRIDGDYSHREDLSQELTNEMVDKLRSGIGDFKCGFIERAAQDAALAAETVEACKEVAAQNAQRVASMKAKRAADAAVQVLSSASVPAEISKPVPDKSAMP